MAQKQPNTRISLSLGLQNNYNVFQLVDNNVINDVGVTIITDGDQYVEDEASSIIHGGNNSWKDFEGIKDISTNDAFGHGDQLTLVGGPKFVSKFRLYGVTTIFAEDGKEIYDSASNYNLYKNQFSAEFVTDNLTTGNILDNDNFNYYDYKQNQREAKGKSVIKNLKYSQVKGDSPTHYMFIKTDIVHYSKYYPIYKNTTMQVPCLQPVLYTKEDVDKYGLFINQDRMYVSKLSMIAAWGDNYGDKIHQRQYYFLAREDNGNFLITNQDNNSFSINSEEKWYDISQYKQGSYGTVHLTEFGEDEAKNYENFYSTGFTIYGFKEEGGANDVFLSSENNTKMATGSIPAAWTKQFGISQNTYDLGTYHKVNDGENNKYPLCTLAFKGDAEDNVHLLNCWFPLIASGSNDNRIVTQQVYLRNTGPKKPDYIGMWIASVFCNVYRYLDSSDYNVNIVQDIVYLSDHYTTFTKDIVYYITSPKTQNGDIDDSIIAFNPRGILSQPIQFGGNTGYVALLKSKAGASMDSHYNSSDKNVKVYIRDCIKNIPLQYRLRYIEPDTSVIGSDNNIYMLRTIDQPAKRMYSNGKLNKDSLYQLGTDADGNTTVDLLGQNFKIRYLSKVSYADDGVTIQGEYATNIPSDTMDMRNLWQMSENLILNRSKFLQPVSNYYALVHNGDSHDLSYKDFDKREVLVPFAKFV